MPRTNIDLDELEKLRKSLPVGKCMDMDITDEGEQTGMQVCRAGENEFIFKSKDGSMKGSLKMTDYKKEEK
jgi:hypothetical protein